MWLLSNKVLVRESGLMEGFRDCHCHLLPGVDDGVQEISETMQILQESELLGVQEVWLTPHIMEDYPNEPEELRRVFNDNLNPDDSRVVGKHFSIRLHLAAEHMMDGLFLRRLEYGGVMPYVENIDLNDNLNEKENGYGYHESKKLLVETSYYTPPMNMADVIERVKARDYEPILAHPERYQYIDRRDYRHWKERGVLFQLNVPSLVGAYGPEVQQKAEWLLKEGMYDHCGTDTHSIEQMNYFLSSEISKKTVKRVKRIAENQEL